MANEEQLAILHQGVEVWNKWREDNKVFTVDLSGVKLADLKLNKVDFSGADLSNADLRKTKLQYSNLNEANLSNADLSGADLRAAEIFEATLYQTRLGNAILMDANIKYSDMSEAKLNKAFLDGANLSHTDLSRADLSECVLINSNLVNVNISDAKISKSKIYGVNIWDLEGEFAEQKDLIITPNHRSPITVDDIEVAQFIYLLLNNQKIRNIIDTVTTKTVLILGRFTEERKQILDALRDGLRKRGFIPILFDFQPSSQRNLTETVQLLANMAKFIVADITEAKSIPQELSHIIPFLPSVPVQPILLVSRQEYSMFENWRDYNSVLPKFLYEDEQHLIDNLEAKVILPVNAWLKDQNKVSLLETKIKELEEERARLVAAGRG